MMQTLTCPHLLREANWNAQVQCALRWCAYVFVHACDDAHVTDGSKRRQSPVVVVRALIMMSPR